MRKKFHLATLSSDWRNWTILLVNGSTRIPVKELRIAGAKNSETTPENSGKFLFISSSITSKVLSYQVFRTWKKISKLYFLSTLHDTPRLHESWIMTQTLPEGILDFILIWLICSWNYKSQQEIPNFRLIPKRPRVDVFGLSLLKWSCSPTNFLMRPPKWPLSIFLSTGADRTIMEKRLICETAYWCWDYMKYF